MTPKIILEGPDNAGKTTLAQWLQDSTSCKYFHAGGPPKDPEAEQACMDLQMNVLKSDDPYVVDRVTALSQPVYNPNPDLEPKRRHWIVDALQIPGVILVFCRPSTEWLSRSDRFTWRPDESEEHRQKIINNHMTFIQRYDRVMTGLPLIFYDFNDSGAGNLRNILRDYVNGSEWERMWLSQISKFNAKR